MSDLKKLAIKHNSDKYESHFYTKIYLHQTTSSFDVQNHLYQVHLKWLINNNLFGVFIYYFTNKFSIAHSDFVMKW